MQHPIFSSGTVYWIVSILVLENKECSFNLTVPASAHTNQHCESFNSTKYLLILDLSRSTKSERPPIDHIYNKVCLIGVLNVILVDIINRKKSRKCFPDGPPPPFQLLLLHRTDPVLACLYSTYN